MASVALRGSSVAGAADNATLRLSLSSGDVCLVHELRLKEAVQKKMKKNKLLCRIKLGNILQNFLTDGI